jgi:uncharacterized metal-binding protein YceD (DUF177 family)
MQIAVSSILQSQRNTNVYPFCEVLSLESEDERLTRAVQGDVTVTRASSRVIRVTGAFDTELTFKCDRCGETFTQAFAFELDETLDVTDSPLTALEVEEAVSPTGQLDLTDLVRQNLLVSLPGRRLCGCSPIESGQSGDILDPRWSALKGFGTN